MQNAYVICMIIGFSFLLLSVLGDAVGNITDALEGIFGFDLDADFDLDLAFLPLSGVSICTALVTFGGVGLLTGNILAAAVGAYLLAMIIQTGIRKLKRVKNEGMSREELYLCDGRIINTVLPGGLGTVEFDNIKGISVTFVCRSENAGEALKPNTQVVLADFDGEVAVVKRKNEFADYEEELHGGGSAALAAKK